MIKLFWNTHNQIQPTSNNPNNEDVYNYKWGLYHKKNSDKWIYHILDKVKFKAIEKYGDLDKDDCLIIIDSSVETKIELYAKLKLICSKVYLIHLGDEVGRKDLNFIYDNCNFVWRSICHNQYFSNEKVICFPPGYKSGVKLKKNYDKRKYKWTFIGNPHTSSRHDLVFQLSSIKPSFCYKIKQFDEKVIESDEYSGILSSTIFLPCPNGTVHPETYRLYEALECECIPITENSYNYFDRMYPNNPFLKISKWTDAKKLINSWDTNQIKKKQKECKLWWIEYKKNLQDSISKKILTSDWKP